MGILGVLFVGLRCRGVGVARTRIAAVWRGSCWFNGRIRRRRLLRRRDARDVALTFREHPYLDDALAIRATRISRLRQADVFGRCENGDQLARLAARVDADERIALRFEAQLKVEHLRQPLQHVGQARIVRNETYDGRAIAAADANLVGKRGWTGRERCEAQSDAGDPEGRVQLHVAIGRRRKCTTRARRWFHRRITAATPLNGV
jgi:hypothetical protein